MKRIFLLTIFCCTTASAIAADAQELNQNAQERAAVLQELSQRSGLPDAELSNLLAICQINQQSMYFCAWRDQIASEREFDRALKAWKQSRDKLCENSAKKEWGEGSMMATAQAICITTTTTRMTKQLDSITKYKH